MFAPKHVEMNNPEVCGSDSEKCARKQNDVKKHRGIHPTL